MTIDNMKRKLQKSLSEDRYQHSLGVMDEAVKLARHYNADIEKAKIAGLLHDCAKNISSSEQNIYLIKYGIILDEIQRKSHPLIHSILGPYVAKEQYEVKDEQILNAILWHTTGRAGMTLLEKIIFIADYIEPKRNFEGTKKIRDFAFADLDKSILLSTEATIYYLVSNGELLHPYTVETRNDAILKVEKARHHYTK